MAPEHDPEADRSWPEYRRLVLSELERIDRGVQELNRKIDARSDFIDTEISKMWRAIDLLQFKSGLISLLVSALTGLAVAIAGYYLKR
jgi:hypothetical protein